MWASETYKKLPIYVIPIWIQRSGYNINIDFIRNYFNEDVIILSYNPEIEVKSLSKKIQEYINEHNGKIYLFAPILPELDLESLEMMEKEYTGRFFYLKDDPYQFTLRKYQ
jgi:hypothetical protein